MLEGQVDPSKRNNLLYDDVERHYYVIAKLTDATGKTYVCRWCNKACRRDVTHVWGQTCSDCMASPLCAISDVRVTMRRMQ